MLLSLYQSVALARHGDHPPCPCIFSARRTYCTGSCSERVTGSQIPGTRTPSHPRTSRGLLRSHGYILDGDGVFDRLDDGRSDVGLRLLVTEADRVEERPGRRVVRRLRVGVRRALHEVVAVVGLPEGAPEDRDRSDDRTDDRVETCDEGTAIDEVDALDADRAEFDGFHCMTLSIGQQK